MNMLDVISLIVALVALAFAVVAVIRARSSDEASAAAAEAAARAAERAESSLRQSAQALTSAQAARQDAAGALDAATVAREDASQARRAASALAPVNPGSAGRGPVEQPAAVSWGLAQIKGANWVLTNTGAVAARSALLTDATQPPKYVRPDEVIPRDVPPGDHLQFHAVTGKGGPPPRVRVIWRQDDVSEPQSQELTLLAE